MHKIIDYSEYKRSVAHAIKPKMKALCYNAVVLKKPARYLFAIVKNAIQRNECAITEKEQLIFEQFRFIQSPAQFIAYAKAVVKKAEETFVEVDEEGELL